MATKVILVLMAAVVAVGCTDTMRASFAAYGERATIRLYAADGHVIHEWVSTGRVECTEGGICDFMDSKTNRLVRTTGDIVVLH